MTTTVSPNVYTKAFGSRRMGYWIREKAASRASRLSKGRTPTSSPSADEPGRETVYHVAS